jgi:homoserine acetyltransferase
MQYPLRLVHQVAKIYYTHEQLLRKVFYDSVPESITALEERSNKIRKYLVNNTDEQLLDADPNCYIRLVDAINHYDLGIGFESYRNGVQSIKCPVLLINFTTDCEFTPEYAWEIGKLLNLKNPGQAEVKIIDTSWGHMGCLQETGAIALALGHFLEQNKKGRNQ